MLTSRYSLGATGIVLGLVATYLMTVYRSPTTYKAVSRVGSPYACLWIVVIGARATFSYGSTHWFSSQLDHRMISNHVSSAAITDALIFMAVAMLLTRTVAMGIRAHHATYAGAGSSTPLLQPA